jgi:Flp pilus assembly protein TadB
MTDTKSLAVGGFAGVAVAGITYVEGLESLQLVVCLGLVWALAGWSLTRNRRLLRNADALPAVLYALLVIGVPMFGVHADLALGDLREPLVFLTMGVAAAGIGLGAEMSGSTEQERTTAVTTAD